jgi:hypothetical protein
MSVQVNTYGTDDGIMGTLVLTLHDPASEVATVRFRVTGADGVPSSPVAADRVPRPGVYEKDVPLALDTETLIEPVVTLTAGGTVPAEAQSFSRISGQMLTLVKGSLTERGSSLEIGAGLALGRTADGRRPVLTGTAPSGTGGTLAVQDADTAATPASTLAFQGTVVSVANGVATLDLDGRYATQTGVSGALAGYYTKAESDGRYPLVAHTHPYLPLGGGVMSDRLQVEKNTVNPNFLNGHVELRTTNGSPVAVGFHRSQFSAVTLRHGVLGALDLVDHDGAWAQYRGSSFWAGGNRFYGGDGAYIDLTNVAAQFLTSGGAALQARVGSLLVSDLYTDAPSVPAAGIYSKGGARLGPYIEVGVTGFRSAIRRPDGAALNLQNAGGGVLNVGDATSTYKLNVQGDVYAQGGWLRTNGTNGWYNETYGGGIYMTDAAYVRLYNGKSLAPNAINLHADSFSHVGTSYGIYFGEVTNAYAIFKSVAWPSSGGGHSRLVINYHTGIVVGAQQGYGGIQFFGTELGAGGAKLFSIGEGDANVRVTNVLYAGNVRAGQALYAAGASTRLSSDDTYWYSTSGNGMRFFGHDGNQRGYIYFDSAAFGLLDAGGNWTVRTWSGGGQLYGGWNTDGAFGANRVNAGYDSGIAGSVNASGWFRSSGSTGWYNATHNTGLYADQSGYVRTYGQSGIQVGGNGLVAVNPVESDTTFGLFFSADRSPAYAVSRAAGAWSSPHPALRIAFHTGIQIGASTAHGGTRFYGSWDMANELMSVGKGDGDVRITNGLTVSGNLRVSGTPTDVYGLSLGSIHLGSSAPANARPGTLWIQV